MRCVAVGVVIAVAAAAAYNEDCDDNADKDSAAAATAGFVAVVVAVGDGGDDDDVPIHTNKSLFPFQKRRINIKNALAGTTHEAPNEPTNTRTPTTYDRLSANAFCLTKCTARHAKQRHTSSTRFMTSFCCLSRWRLAGV